MDCVACGKPISITAKFCGKCGAPVKRPEPAVTEAMAQPEAPVVQGDALHGSHPEAAVTLPQVAETESVNDLVLTIELPAHADHPSLMKIDLNLPAEENAEADTPTEAQHAAAPLAPSPSLPLTSDRDALTKPMGNTDQSDIKQMLEKHSHLLDYISLAAQQQAHVQSQPNPIEPLLRDLLTQQSTLAAKLDAIKEIAAKPPNDVTVRLPDEFKLLLEKQKIELLKAFSQNVAQNTANIEAIHKETADKIETLLSAHATTAQALEKNMVPIVQTVTDMKSRLQTVSKKIDDAASPVKKSKPSGSGDSTEGSGGFIIFIIGLLCGLTVVLSSLAIYNFLSHEASSPAKSAHDEAAADHGKPADHEDASHAPSTAHEPASHDKPPAEAKDKSH